MEDVPVSHDGDQPQGVGGRLRRDLEAAGVSARGLARRLKGELASKEAVEQQRREVTRWLSYEGEKGMSREKAEAVAAILGTDPERYLSAYYSPTRKLEREAERYQEKLREIRLELDRLRGRESKPVDE